MHQQQAAPDIFFPARRKSERSRVSASFASRRETRDRNISLEFRRRWQCIGGGGGGGGGGSVSRTILPTVGVLCTCKWDGFVSRHCFVRFLKVDFSQIPKNLQKCINENLTKVEENFVSQREEMWQISIRFVIV